MFSKNRIFTETKLSSKYKTDACTVLLRYLTCEKRSKRQRSMHASTGLSVKWHNVSLSSFIQKACHMQTIFPFFRRVIFSVSATSFTLGTYVQGYFALPLVLRGPCAR